MNIRSDIMPVLIEKILIISIRIENTIPVIAAVINMIVIPGFERDDGGGVHGERYFR
jgi:hypothetical protein